MKKSLSLLLAIALVLCLAPGAFALVGQSESFYVADYSNVLKNSTEEMIIDYNAQLEQQCQGAQIVVVTVDYLSGMYADEYAYELFNDWGVGSADYNNGMLLLLATQEGKAWLACGLGIGSVMDDDLAGLYLDSYFWDDFDRNDFDTAVNKLFTALVGWYDSVYGSHILSGQAQQTRPAQSGLNGPESTGMRIGIWIFIIVLIIVLIAVSSATRRRRRYRSVWTTWRRTPPPPPPPGFRPPYNPPPRRNGPPPPPPGGSRGPGMSARPSSPPRSSRPSGGRSGGGAGRGGFSGGSGCMGSGGGGFSGGGAGRR